MSKKRVKSGAGSASAQRWEQALLSTPLTEEGKWSVTIGFVAGNNLDDDKHIEALTSAVKAGSRRLFSIVNKDELFAQVNDLGNPKNKKAKEIPQYYEVCEPCKEYLDSGENIPVALLAKLLKFKLLDVKQADLRRRELESKAEQGKDKPNKKGADKKDRKSAKGAKGGKKTPEPAAAKEGSKLKKRGEEDLDNKYIDDEPDDGSSHYVFVTGFHEPHLIGQLSEIGIDVDCLIKVESENYSIVLPTDPASDDLDPAPEKDEKQIAAEEEAKRIAAKKTKELKRFWKDIYLILSGAPQTSKLQDVACLDYIVKEAIVPKSLEDNEAKSAYGVALFEDLACLLYDLIDSKRQWKNFLSNLKLIHVPVFGQPLPQISSQESQSAPSLTPAAPAKAEKPDKGDKGAPAMEVAVQSETESTKAPTEVDMRYYNELMNCVPMESASVPLIMHCMLEQIIATEEDKELPSETPRAPRSDGLDEELAKHIGSLAFKLALSEEEQQLLASEFEPPKKPEPVPKQPILLNYRDDVSHRLNHLQPVGDFNPVRAELEMLGYLPVADLQHVPGPSPHELKERLARLQSLLHFCATGGITAAEVDHAFRQFVFEAMNLTETDSDGTVKEAVPSVQKDIPWDDPYPYFVGMIPKPEETPIAEDITMLERSGARSPELDERVVQSGPEQLEGKPSSRPPSPGILKRPGSATSRKSLSVPSVHFERDDQGRLVDEPGDEEDQPQPTEDHSPDFDPMDVVNDVQKRNLDQWCFAEHLEPSIFLQVLHESVYTHPYIDTYYHKRDNTMLVVLHNPYGQNLLRDEEWTCSVHSNVGFRDYLEHIADSIKDWVRDEEAKYQARLLAQEVERIHREADEASSQAVSVKDKKRDRSKSPKKSPSRSGKSGSRSSSTERPSSSNPFIRDGSLKAYKEELDRAKAEEEEREKLKQEKRIRSASRKAAKEQADEKDKKRPSSRSSSKSKISKEEVPPVSEKPEEPKVEEPYFPFTGYDMGTQLLHAKGRITSMYPADGGQIRTEKYHFEKGVVGVKSVVMKDGHTFMVHVLEPKDPKEEEADISDVPSLIPDGSTADGQEKAEVEKSEKEDLPDSRANTPLDGDEGHGTSSVDEAQSKQSCIGQFGSFSVQLCDGMSLALSTYGASGEPIDGKKYEPAPYIPPPARSPSPTSKDATSPTKSNKKDKKDRSIAPTTPEPAPPQEEVKMEVKEEVKIPPQPFQQLFVTCPDGLRIHYYLASSVGVAPSDPSIRELLVRQSYPFATSGIQPTEALRKVAMDELSRVTNSDGTVVRVMKDGTTQVLFANGTVSQFVLSSPLIAHSRSASQQRASSAKSEQEPTSIKKKERGRSASKKKEQPVPEAPVEEVTVDPGYWITTRLSGERIATAMDGSKVEIKDALVSKATDPQTKQVMFTREDGTVLVQHPDGTTVVEHADGTRITTFNSDIKVPTEGGQEDSEETDMETKHVKLIQVECPGYATLRFDSETSECSTEFGTGTIINTFLDGSYDVYHSDGGYLQIEADGTAVYNSRPNNDLEVADHNQRLQYIMSHFSDIIVEMVDNQGNLFSVNSMGECNVMPGSGEQLLQEQILSSDRNEKSDKEKCDENKQSEGQVTEQGQEGDHSEVGENQPADMAKPATETQSIVTYKQHAPRFFIVHPDGSATQLLRFQDVSEFIAAAEDDLSTAILMDSLPDYPDVIGITVLKPYLKDVSSRWIRDYSQRTIIPPGLTSRNLTTMPAKEVKLEGPGFGTNVGQGLAVGSLVKAPPQPPVLKCPSSLEIRQLLQYKPVSEELRDKLGSRLREYAEYMKARLKDDEALQIQDPRSEEEKILAADLKSQLLGDPDIKSSRLGGDVKDLYEKATAPPIPSPPPTPQPKRTQADWDADRRELAQEQEHRRALDKHEVPPYFESQLGKSFLLTQAPDMDALSRQLVEDPRQDDSRAIRSESNTPQSEHTNFSSSVPPLERISRSDQSTSTNSPAPAPTGNTPSTLRPGNPTPAHATGQGSPTSLRPHNPTPAHATKVVPDRPGAPTPAGPGLSGSPSGHLYPSIPEQPNEHMFGSDQPRTDILPSKQLNVVGENRREPIRVPAYIKAGKPGEVPNTKFLEIEDPVRRKTYTTSITGATDKGSYLLSRMRGFEVLPDYVDFGTLKEGNTYHVTVYLKNTGIDSCRFRVRQPPPSTGMKVIYKPGPVAAGMKTELIIEIYAIAVGVEGDRGIGIVTHDLEIVSEANQLMLPITATVFTANEYDNRNLSQSCKAPGVRLVNDKAPGPTAIIRPRKFDKNGKAIEVH